MDRAGWRWVEGGWVEVAGLEDAGGEVMGRYQY